MHTSHPVYILVMFLVTLRDFSADILLVTHDYLIYALIYPEDVSPRSEGARVV